MMASGMSVEMWRAKLSGGHLKSVKTYSILADRKTDAKALVTASAQFSEGRWTVVFTKPLSGSGKAISPGKTYTFGLAIHGPGLKDGNHWVSLPMTFSLDNFDTYFIAR